MNYGWTKKKFTLFMFYLDVYLISEKSSTCNCRTIVKYFHYVTLDNMTYVNLGTNAFCISTSTLDEIVALGIYGLSWHIPMQVEKSTYKIYLLKCN